MHKRLHDGEPCNCRWGEIHKRDPERVGALKEASKLEWLQGRPDVQNDPEKNLIANHILPKYPASADSLMPWLMREHKKKRLLLDDGTKRRLEIAQEATEDGDHEAAAHHLQGAQSRARQDGHLNLADGALYHPGEADEEPSKIHMGDALSGYADMLGDLSKRRQGVDVMQHDIHSLHDKWSEWELERQEKQRADMGKVVHDFGDGYTVRQLQNRDELQDEGHRMGHCVGGHHTPYDIYSLRDKRNMPHATVEVNPDGGVVQVQGKENHEPVDDYQNKLADWFADGSHANGSHFHAKVPPREMYPASSVEELRDQYNGGGDYGDEEEDPYRISARQADNYGLDYDDVAEQPAPDWESIAENAIHPNPYDDPTRAHLLDGRTDALHAVPDIADEMGATKDLHDALLPHLDDARKDFYTRYHDPSLPWSAQDQWHQYPDARVLHNLHGGYAPLEDGDVANPNTVHPDQQMMFYPHLQMHDDHPGDMSQRG